MALHALTVILAATAVATVVILTLWVYPGYLSTSPNCPIHTSVDGRAYCAESVTVGQCVGPQGCPPTPPTVVFHSVIFQIELGGSSGLADLNGRVTEGNSTSYQFHLVGDYLGAPSVNWTSPDHAVLVEMQAPYAVVGSNGQLTANVTCGVLLATMIGA